MAQDLAAKEGLQQARGSARNERPASACADHLISTSLALSLLSARRHFRCSKHKHGSPRDRPCTSNRSWAALAHGPFAPSNALGPAGGKPNFVLRAAGRHRFRGDIVCAHRFLLVAAALSALGLNAGHRERRYGYEPVLHLRSPRRLRLPRRAVDGESLRRPKQLQ